MLCSMPLCRCGSECGALGQAEDTPFFTQSCRQQYVISNAMHYHLWVAAITNNLHQCDRRLAIVSNMPYMHIVAAVWLPARAVGQTREVFANLLSNADSIVSALGRARKVGRQGAIVARFTSEPTSGNIVQCERMLGCWTCIF